MTGERIHRGRAAFAAALACALAALVAARLAPPAAAAPQAHPVEIRSNFFTPRVINISPGDTVTWTALDAGHTVQADDGRFNFFPQRFLNRNEQVSFTFLTEETVRYHCRVHGAAGGGGMSGIIVVGAGSPSPTPTATPTIVEHRWVPSEYPTIAGALDGVAPGGVVHLAAGVYREAVQVRTPGVAIVGDGPPDAVVIDGQGLRRTGVLLAAAGTSLDNVTVTGHTAEGVAVRGVAGARVTGVVAEGNGGYGILVADSSGTVVSGAASSGHRIAGIAVQGCDECDAIVQDSSASGNLYGVLIDDAGSVVVRRNRIAGNGTGVAARSLATGDETIQRGVHVVGNEITGNDAAIPAASLTEFAVRSGVWLSGAWFAVVEGNRIEGHDYGVLVAATGVPAMDARIAGNVVGGSRAADLAWDGIGAGVCFERNTGAAGESPSTRPPAAETLYACGGLRGPGIPDPIVIASLAGYALGQ